MNSSWTIDSLHLALILHVSPWRNLGAPEFVSIKFHIILNCSTNRAIYAGSQTVRVRALLLTTSLKPYEGIADLYLIDPDGYVIRKWNSMEMNVGVLLQDFDLPNYPKVSITYFTKTYYKFLS